MRGKRKTSRWFRLSFLVATMATTGVLVTTRPIRVRAEDPPGDITSIGVLQYTAPPDITICFCGSFFLHADKEYRAFYLYSSEIDLTKFVGKKVLVMGKPFKTPCQGTLYRLCSFLEVKEVEPVAPTPADTSTWGRIKSLYD